MAFITRKNRNQMMFLPPCIENYISKEHPARIIDWFVESLDVKKLGVRCDEYRVGAPNYPPKSMLKIILYSYSIGERSSRRMERLCGENLALIWLSGDLHPDFRTIARFRINNLKAIKSLLKETIKLYKDLNVKFDGIVYFDGTKIEANASVSATINGDGIKKLEEQVEKILKEAEEIDKKENIEFGKGINGYKVNKKALGQIKEKIEEYKKKLEDKNTKNFNTTDEDAKFMKIDGKIKPGYNSQLGINEDMIIVSSEVVNAQADNHQLSRQVEKAEENLEEKVKVCVSDSGYFETNEVKKVMDKERETVVPMPMDEARERGYDKKIGTTSFKEDKENKVFICPQGQTLKYIKDKVNNGKKYKVYAAEKEDCLLCQLKEKCCFNNSFKQYGRTIMILKDRKFIEKYRQIIGKPKNKELIKKRKYKIEPVFGIIKCVYKFKRFLLRGLSKVNIEWNLISTIYNLMRMKNLFGIAKMKAKLIGGYT